MVNRVRSRLSYANVVATFALVFAMSGGAYAANRFLITSSKQISPKVLKALKGAPGKAGANGAQGPVGPAGAVGAQGPAGPAGAAGVQGVPGGEGKEGKPGTTGFTKTLPSGETETGAWAVQTRGEALGMTSISFPIPLENALGASNVVFVGPEETKAHCEGTVASPEAEKGFLCVYAQSLGELTPSFAGAIVNPSAPTLSGGAGAGASGALVLLSPPEGSEVASAWGTWAVTAG